MRSHWFRTKAILGERSRTGKGLGKGLGEKKERGTELQGRDAGGLSALARLPIPGGRRDAAFAQLELLHLAVLGARQVVDHVDEARNREVRQPSLAVAGQLRRIDREPRLR